MKLLSVCSGIGGLDLAVEQCFGAELVAFAENDARASAVLEKHWPGVPNVGDLKTADWAALERQVGSIDIIAGGIPCQPWSHAGKLKRTADERHLWPAVRDAVRVLRPRYVVVEEVRGFLADGGLAVVLADLCDLGFDASWLVVRASDVGAPHRRERVFLLAWDAANAGRDGLRGGPQRDGAEDRIAGGVRPSSARGDDADGRLLDSRGDQRGELSLLPTPLTDPLAGNGHARDLGSEVKLLPTPSAEESTPTDEYVDEMLDAGVSADERLYLPGRKYHAQRTLSRLAPVLFPTPTARLGTPRGAQADRYKNPERSNDLDDAAAWAEREARWGDYAPAIERWERVLGREAPAPLEGKRLSPSFVEFMMGYEAGWTEGHSRVQRLKMLGNAVVTRQAVFALTILANRP